MPASIFAEEWRDCLRAHYSTVVRNQDHVTEKTLRTVMFEAGFSDDDLKQLYILATAHVDQVSEDFVPDMEFLKAQAETSAVIVPVAVPAVALPQEVIEAEIVEESVALDEAADAEAEGDEADQSDQEAQDEQDEVPKDDPGITQLSLF